MNTKRISLALILGLLLITVAACVNADAKTSKTAPVSKTVSIGDFDEIEVATGINVVFSQGPNPGTAKIETTSAVADRLVVRTEKRTLKVFFKSTGINLKSNGKTTVTVSSPSLSEIEASSSGNVTVTGNLKSNGKISVETSSSGSVTLGNVACQKLDLESSSSGSVNVKSLTGNLDADASSSGSVSVEAMTGNRLESEASSSGSVSILRAVCTVIDAEAESSGTVSLKGIKCETVEAEASSSGTVVLEGECRFLKEDANSAGKVRHSNLKITL